MNADAGATAPTAPPPPGMDAATAAQTARALAAQQQQQQQQQRWLASAMMPGPAPTAHATAAGGLHAMQAAMQSQAALAAALANPAAMAQAMHAMAAMGAGATGGAFPAPFAAPSSSPFPPPGALMPPPLQAMAAAQAMAQAAAARAHAAAPPPAAAPPERAPGTKAEAPEAMETDDANASAAAPAAPEPPPKKKRGRPKKDPNAPPKTETKKAATAATSTGGGDAATGPGPGGGSKNKTADEKPLSARGGVDPEVAAAIPPELLREALVAEEGGGRRSGRKTKARVIMIDGEPVLRSNAYTMEDGEPSVFDKELDKDAREEGREAGMRTSYVFEEKKKGKPRKPYGPRKPKVMTEADEENSRHNKEMMREIELAKKKRAYYLKNHMKALAPFVEEKVRDKIIADGEAYAPSEKILTPVDNQPEKIKAVLREYQLEGIRWMTRMYDDGCSCILADEMGLGKTLQSISFLACLHEMRNVKGPHLVICPLSVLSSWMDELQKWCPSFRVVRLHSTDENERQRLRKEVVMNVGSYDVAVTTYEMACNPTFNLTLSQKVYWRTMILDEGHKVKNEETAAHGVLSRVHRQHTLLLTGTPVQNNLHELYAILAFLHPDVFTSAKAFDAAFDLGSKEHKVDSGTLNHAHFLMKPFVLRRIKGEVEVSLPEKTETKIMCPLSPAQTFWYRRLLMRESGALNEAESAMLRKHSGGGGGGGDGAKSSEGGGGGGGGEKKLQSLLMQLRKCCNHPFLFAGTDVPEDGVPIEELVEASGKLAVLDRILRRLKDAGHRVVLFSQFTSMLDILSDFLTLRGYQARSIHWFPYDRVRVVNADP